MRPAFAEFGVNTAESECQKRSQKGPDVLADANYQSRLKFARAENRRSGASEYG